MYDLPQIEISLKDVERFEDSVAGKLRIIAVPDQVRSAHSHELPLEGTSAGISGSKDIAKERLAKPEAGKASISGGVSDPDPRVSTLVPKYPVPDCSARDESHGGEPNPSAVEHQKGEGPASPRAARLNGAPKGKRKFT